jgi:hypothetical protein
MYRRRRILRTFHIAVDFKLVLVKGRGGGRGGGSALLPSPSLPCRDEVNSLCPCGGGGTGRESGGEDLWIGWALKITEYRMQNTPAAKLMTHVNKLPMYLFFYMALGLYDFDGGKFIRRAIGKVGP